MRPLCPGVLYFGNVGLRNNLILRILEQKFLFLTFCHPSLFIYELPAGTLIKPVRFMLGSADSGRPDLPRQCFQASMKIMIAKEIRVTYFILTVCISRYQRNYR